MTADVGLSQAELEDFTPEVLDTTSLSLDQSVARVMARLRADA
jgi:hypothetical protein